MIVLCVCSYVICPGPDRRREDLLLCCVDCYSFVSYLSLTCLGVSVCCLICLTLFARGLTGGCPGAGKFASHSFVDIFLITESVVSSLFIRHLMSYTGI